MLYIFNKTNNEDISDDHTTFLNHKFYLEVDAENNKFPKVY